MARGEPHGNRRQGGYHDRRCCSRRNRTSPALEGAHRADKGRARRAVPQYPRRGLRYPKHSACFDVPASWCWSSWFLRTSRRQRRSSSCVRRPASSLAPIVSHGSRRSTERSTLHTSAKSDHSDRRPGRSWLLATVRQGATYRPRASRASTTLRLSSVSDQSQSRSWSRSMFVGARFHELG